MKGGWRWLYIAAVALSVVHPGETLCVTTFLHRVCPFGLARRATPSRAAVGQHWPRLRSMSKEGIGSGAFADISPSLANDSPGGTVLVLQATPGLPCGEGNSEVADTEAWVSKWSDVAAGTVLIVGDGNLSFSLALARAFPNMRLFATTYDAEEFVLNRYGAGDVIRELKERGATVLHDVDATALDKTLLPRLDASFDADCIAFNFPHHPGKGRIQKNRDLVREFFMSATPHLSPTGHIRVSLAAGQGGTPVDKPRMWGDTWQVTAQGAAAGLLLSDIYSFAAPPGYYCRGYKSQDKGFHLVGAMQHVFVPDTRAITGLYPPHWPHDISFWAPPAFSDHTFQQLARAIPHVTSVDMFDTFLRQELPPAAAEVVARQGLALEYQESRSYRITYSSATLAVSKETARAMQMALRERAVAELRVVLR